MTPWISMRKVVQAGRVVVLDEKNPHVRKQSRWHSHQAGCERGCASMKLVRYSAGKDGEWLECNKQACKTEDEVQQ